jgi:superfamily I DNA and/or RNA helicase
MEYLEKNKIITISLGNKVKEKIINKFNSDIEEFIEKEFPQDEELKIFIFKHKSKDKNKIGIKINDSDYILFVERSVDNLRNKIDNYMFCFDIQKKPEIIIDENNDFLDIECEVKIPIEFNREYYNNSTKILLDGIEEKFEELKPYKTQSLEENEEYKKWFVYLSLLEKLIDAKDFYIETEISYSKNKATISVNDNNIFEKLKKARGEDFIFYYPENVDKNKKLHEWDEDRRNSKDNFFGKLDRQFNANKKEFTFILSEEFKKEFTNNEHNEIISSALDDLNFAMKARQFIEEKVNSTTQIKKHILKLNIKDEEKNILVKLFSKISKEYAHYSENEYTLSNEEKDNINNVLSLLGNTSSKKFNPREKLILRVSYFRDQFQLKTLKQGLERIQNHPLKPYLFGDKKLPIINQNQVDNFEIKYLSKVLNDKQKEAIKKALISQELFMIQGPPGTGKTEVISEIAYQEAIRGKKVLITSQANMAVDNAIQRLNHPSLYPIRIIRKDYEPEDGESLPIEQNLGNFYKNRIIRNLTNDLNNNKKELKNYENILEDFLSDLKIEEDENIYDEELGYLSSNYMHKLNIWGATLFETGKYSFKDKSFDVIIVDEVSKATPPELVLPILKGQKLILVGDHKQLPPIIKDVSLEDIAEECNISLDSLDFDTTVFEKLIQNNPDNYVMLDTQYRMHPDIQKAINQFYRDEKNNEGLKCGLKNPDLEKCHQIQDKTFHKKHLIWLKTKKSDEETKQIGSTSYFNEAEIKRIKITLDFLNKSYEKVEKKPSVGVITFYGKQLGELTNLEKKGFWRLPIEDRNYPNLDIRFGTVDRFQGQEKDIIIVSLVRNNKKHEVGFAKKPHRINVAFSRARNLLIIVGNPDNFRFGKNEKSAQQYDEIFNIAKKFGSVQGE